MDDPRLRVCLERNVDLAPTHLRLHDWPGLGGPLIHLAYPPGSRAATAVDWLGGFPPRYRVMSLEPRADCPYQVDAADLLAVLDQFGFLKPVLIGERQGCLPALLVAAWHPGRVAGLVMVEPTSDAPPGNGVAARALRDCPPDWLGLRQAVQCPVLVLGSPASPVQSLEGFLRSIELAG